MCVAGGSVAERGGIGSRKALAHIALTKDPYTNPAPEEVHERMNGPKSEVPHLDVVAEFERQQAGAGWTDSHGVHPPDRLVRESLRPHP
jgi:hypothetical protein